MISCKNRNKNAILEYDYVFCRILYLLSSYSVNMRGSEK